MKKSILIIALATLASLSSAHAQKSDSALLRLGNVLQKAGAYNQCTITVTPSTIKFGDADLGRGEIPTLEIAIKTPKGPEFKIVTTDVKAMMNRGDVYNRETKDWQKSVLSEVIEAFVLDSDYSLPNKLVLHHDGSGKITDLEYIKATANMDGKGPFYSGNSLRCSDR